MTRDVLISISGSQSSESDQDEIEMVTTGNYFFKEGKHYILYEEIADKGDVIKNTIKVTKDSMEMIKRGSASLHMVFHILLSEEQTKAPSLSSLKTSFTLAAVFSSIT